METLDLQPDADYWVGERYVQPVLNRVSDGGEAVSVEPRVMAVLSYLARRAGQVVTRDELLEAVWVDVVVNEDALTRAVSELRKLFDDDPRAPAVVETIRGRGYRLIAPVRAGDPLSLTGDGAMGDGVRHMAGEARGAMGPGDPPDAVVPVPRLAVPAAPHPVPMARRPVVWIGAAALLAAVAAFALWPSAPGARTSVRFAPATPFTTYPGREIEPAISPEGTRVAFAWNGPDDGGFHLYVKQAGREDAVRLTDGDAVEHGPAWSPDGSTLAFLRQGDEPGIYTIPSMGGVARRIYAARGWIQSVDWSPDGATLAFAQAIGEEPVQIWTLDLRTGQAAAVTEAGAERTSHLSPRFAPGGCCLAYVRAGFAGGRALVLRSLETGAERDLTDDQLGIRGFDWLDDASVVVSSFRSGTYGLWRVDIDTGETEWIPTTGQRSYAPSVAGQTGEVAYQEIHFEKNVWRIRLDGPGGAVLGTEPLITSTWYDCEAYIAPTGDRLAFMSGRSGSLELWLSDPDGASPVAVTAFGGAFVGNPRWAPDGRRIAFYASPNGSAAVFVADVQGGPPRQITPDGWNARVTGWTSDGTGLYFTSDQTGTWELWRVAAGGGAPVQVTRDGALSAAEASDGEALFVTRPDVPGLWRIPLADGRPAGEASLVLEDLPVRDAGNWVLIESGVYFLTRDAGDTFVSFHDFATGAARTVTDVSRIADPSLSASPDGATLLYGRVERSESDLFVLAPAAP